jgi:quinol monooxygenase YgiN
LSERVVVFTRLTAAPGRRDELLAVLEELGRETRTEPGNQAFEAHAARDEPDVVLGYEVFDDEHAVTEHRATEAVRRAREQLPDLLAGDPEISYAIG